MNMKKRMLGTAAGLLAAVLLFSCPASALSAGSYILVDGATGRVLEEKQPDRRSLIASTTKIMTALLVCEQCNVLDRFRIPQEATGVEGSSLYLQEGEVLTVQELLYGLMLHSGNDAARALAIYCGGTVEGFVELMNDRARSLGLTGTHFANPCGLDHPEHYSTARDLAVLTACAMENPIFAKTVSTKTVQITGRSLTNHNKLLWRVEVADGVKTGYTKAAGRILVSSAQRQGRRLIAVTIDDPDDWKDHAYLLEKGFERFRLHKIITSGSQLGVRTVIGGEKQQVPLLADADFSCALAEGEQVTMEIPGPFYVYAPIRAGERAGFAWVMIDGKPLGRVPLCYGDSAPQTKEKTIWEKFQGGIQL